MTNTKAVLNEWQLSLCKSIDHGGLISRSSVAHKWKAPFRSLIIRETVCWRTHDLLSQAYFLLEAKHVLGSRILLRSAFETMAVLVYLNQLTRKVLAGAENFHDFSNKTTQLLLGSKDKSTKHEAINILTVLKKCDERFPGIAKHYAALSEAAHPNFEGICIGFSDIDTENFVTTFSNKWAKMYGSIQVGNIDICIELFNYEYNEEWPAAFDELENWIISNDDELEATKS